MSEVYLTATINPAEGKAGRIRELLSNLAKEVKTNEPGALQYHVFEQVNAENGQNAFIVHETYKDQAASDAHFETPYFKKLGEAIGTEGLLAGALDLKFSKSIAGYESK